MEKRKPEEYAFSCSIVRAKEKTLLSKSDYERLLDCKSVNQAMAFLADFGYGNGRELSNQREYAGILEQNLSEAYKLVLSSVPDKEELELITYINDYHNLKSIIKAQSLGIDPLEGLTDNGKYSKEMILEMIREKNYIPMSLTMKHGIEDVAQQFAKGKDPQDIDIILDIACYKEMLEKANELGNDFIIKYLKLCIDIINVNTFARLKEKFKNFSFFEKVFIKGGNIELKILEELFEEGFKQIAEKLAPYGFKDVLLVGAEHGLISTGGYSALERESDNLKMKYLKDAKYVSMGIEPIFGYIMAKEMEVKNIRMILVGIIAGVPKDVTLGRLRETYV